MSKTFNKNQTIQKSSAYFNKATLDEESTVINP